MKYLHFLNFLSYLNYNFFQNWLNIDLNCAFSENSAIGGKILLRFDLRVAEYV